jgi:hypothetical protein
MPTLALILFIAALVLFILGAIPVSSRVNLVSAGLACALAAFLLRTGVF